MRSSIHFPKFDSLSILRHHQPDQDQSIKHVNNNRTSECNDFKNIISIFFKTFGVTNEGKNLKAPTDEPDPPPKKQRVTKPRKAAKDEGGNGEDDDEPPTEGGNAAGSASAVDLQKLLAEARKQMGADP